MRIALLRAVGVAVVLALAAACGTPDEAPPASVSTVSTASAPPTPASAMGSAAGTATVPPPTSVESPAPPPSAVSSDVPTSAVAPADAVGTGGGAPIGTLAESTALSSPPVAATVTAAPSVFPDPAEVEAQGVATNPLCEVLSVDEVDVLLGAPVRAAVDAASGTGCLWSGATSDSSFLQLQMLGDPARYAPPGDAEVLDGIADAAFVLGTGDTWTAQAQNPDGTFAVQLGGPTATRDGAVTGLQRLLERY
ncbi:hypothetical protein [Nakamurella deserti]|uniref:hypothetical protein n=1 Tax=Nakamurella deserti TaxID=2164074 RepID=UPI0013007870|nr:hypothetical protein [Nakamurella deserti]